MIYTVIGTADLYCPKCRRMTTHRVEQANKPGHVITPPVRAYCVAPEEYWHHLSPGHLQLRRRPCESQVVSETRLAVAVVRALANSTEGSLCQP